MDTRARTWNIPKSSYLVCVSLCRALLGSFSPSTLLQLPHDPLLALTLPDELLESEPDSH